MSARADSAQERMGGVLRAGAVVLAAGASSRMGSPKALLLHRDGRTFLRTTCEALGAAGLAPIAVVVGHRREQLEPELRSLEQTAVCPVLRAINPAPERGQISSLAIGLQALAGQGVRCALVALVDQPALPREVLDTLARAALREPDAVHVPLFAGVRGHPAAFPTGLGGRLAQAGPDESTRDALARLGVPVREHAVDRAAVLIDLDTPEELAAWRAAEAR